MKITRNGQKWGKWWRNLKNLKSCKSKYVKNRSLTYGCEVYDRDFRKDIWVSILLPKYRYYINTYFLRYFPSLTDKILFWLALYNAPNKIVTMAVVIARAYVVELWSVIKYLLGISQPMLSPSNIYREVCPKWLFFLFTAVKRNCLKKSHYLRHISWPSIVLRFKLVQSTLPW